MKRLAAAPLPGKDKILAFYDSRVNAFCRDGNLLLVPLSDHMCHRGDGLFESISCRNGRIFAIGEHLDRLSEGKNKLKIALPRTLPEIALLCAATARIGGKADCNLRLFLSRGPGGFGVSPAECPAPSLYIVALEEKPPSPEIFQKGLSAFTSKYPPKQGYLAGVKNTNYLPNVLMALEAAERGEDVAITLDENGDLCEAAIANIAIVDARGRLRSPEIRRILPGTTLLLALRLAAEKMEVIEGPVKASDVASAREMLLLTSSSLCVPITSFDGKPVGDGKPGPVAAWLAEELYNYLYLTGMPFMQG